MILPVVVEHSYQIGDAVSGKNCEGRPFTGTVTALGGRYSVFVDSVFTPCSLIDGHRDRRVPPIKIGTVEFPKPVDAGGIFD